MIVLVRIGTVCETKTNCGYSSPARLNSVLFTATLLLQPDARSLTKMPHATYYTVGPSASEPLNLALEVEKKQSTGQVPRETRFLPIEG